MRTTRMTTRDPPGSILIPYRNPTDLLRITWASSRSFPVSRCLLGPAAIILGILGIRASSANARAGGTGHAVAGLGHGFADHAGEPGHRGDHPARIVSNDRWAAARDLILRPGLSRTPEEIF